MPRRHPKLEKDYWLASRRLIDLIERNSGLGVTEIARALSQRLEASPEAVRRGWYRWKELEYERRRVPSAAKLRVIVEWAGSRGYLTGATGSVKELIRWLESDEGV